MQSISDIKDLSDGKEAVAIHCVNHLDRKYPEFVEYTTTRVAGKDVKLNNEAAFRVCCDCTDGCRVRDHVTVS